MLPQNLSRVSLSDLPGEQTLAQITMERTQHHHQNPNAPHFFPIFFFFETDRRSSEVRVFGVLFGLGGNSIPWKWKGKTQMRGKGWEGKGNGLPISGAACLLASSLLFSSLLVSCVALCYLVIIIVLYLWRDFGNLEMGCFFA